MLSGQASNSEIEEHDDDDHSHVLWRRNLSRKLLLAVIQHLIQVTNARFGRTPPGLENQVITPALVHKRVCKLRSMLERHRALPFGSEQERFKYLLYNEDFDYLKLDAVAIAYARCKSYLAVIQTWRHDLNEVLVTIDAGGIEHSGILFRRSADAVNGFRQQLQDAALSLNEYRDGACFNPNNLVSQIESILQDYPDTIITNANKAILEGASDALKQVEEWRERACDALNTDVKSSVDEIAASVSDRLARLDGELKPALSQAQDRLKEQTLLLDAVLTRTRLTKRIATENSYLNEVVSTWKRSIEELGKNNIKRAFGGEPCLDSYADVQAEVDKFIAVLAADRFVVDHLATVNLALPAAAKRSEPQQTLNLRMLGQLALP